MKSRVFIKIFVSLISGALFGTAIGFLTKYAVPGFAIVGGVLAGLIMACPVYLIFDSFPSFRKTVPKNH